MKTEEKGTSTYRRPKDSSPDSLFIVIRYHSIFPASHLQVLLLAFAWLAGRLSILQHPSLLLCSLIRIAKMLMAAEWMHACGNIYIYILIKTFIITQDWAAPIYIYTHSVMHIYSCAHLLLQHGGIKRNGGGTHTTSTLRRMQWRHRRRHFIFNLNGLLHGRQI